MTLIKKLLVLIIILSVPELSNSQILEKEHFNSDEEVVEFFNKLAKTYNSDALMILQSDPKATYLTFVDSRDRLDVLRSYETAVHETVHGMNYTKVSSYFITGDVKIEYKETDIFLSSELNNMVSADTQGKILRYALYIQGGEWGDDVNSIQSGIYGIMDEYNAYFHGAKAAMELYDYYKELKDIPSWTRYLQHIDGTISSYYEFRLFIAWYGIYAKKNHADVYSSFMENKELKVAFTLIDQMFEELIERREQLNDLVAAEIRKLGGQIQEMEGDMAVSYPQGMLFLQGWENQVAYVKSLFGSKELAMLQELRLKGITLGNYQTFLK